MSKIRSDAEIVAGYTNGGDAMIYPVCPTIFYRDTRMRRHSFRFRFAQKFVTILWGR